MKTQRTLTLLLAALMAAAKVISLSSATGAPSFFVQLTSAAPAIAAMKNNFFMIFSGFLIVYFLSLAPPQAIKPVRA